MISAGDGSCSEESIASEFIGSSEESRTADDSRNIGSSGPKAVPLNERLALSIEEAGALLGISRDLAYDLVARRELPSVRLGRRLVVPRLALEAALSRLTEAE
jgi:excisionase family DNA binding protein